MLPYVEATGFEILNEDERAVQQAIHKFAREVMRPAGIAIDKLSAEESIAPGSPYWEFMKIAAESGIGFDSGPTDMPADALARMQAIVVEELGWADVGLTVSLAAAAFPHLKAQMAGNAELVGLAEGKLGCWIATQPDRGSDGTMLYPGERHAKAPTGNKGNLTAKVRGGDIVINGQSSAWVSNGAVAQVGILSIAADYGDGFFDADGHPNGMEVIVPFDLPGVSHGRPLEKFGQRALPQGEVIFDNVTVPKSFAVSYGQDYWRGHANTWSTAGVAMGQMMSGMARAALEYAVSYAHERSQGGALLADHQLIQSRLGTMARNVETIRAVARRATEYTALSPAKHPYYTGSTKVTCTDLAFDVVDEALQIFGGYGLTREYPLEKLFRDARAARIEDGENHLLNMKFGFLASQLYRAHRPGV
jgi:alkylation response protein AidB-like acyl-CoA dehydrogenase